MDEQRRRLVMGSAVSILVAGTPAWAGQAGTQGVTDDMILLGSHQDLSGPVASLGGPLREGMQLAVDDINAAGGIHGRKLRLLVEDSMFDPKRAVLATEKLVRQDKVFAMIASLGSATVQASMPLMLDAGVPVLFSGTPADFNYTPFNRIKFALNIPYGEQVRSMVRYAVDTMGKRRVGVLYQDDETGHNVLRATETQLKTHDMKVVEKVSYKRGAVDFSSQIARLRAADVDVVILGTIIRETAAAMMEARKLGWDVDMMVTNAGMNDAVVKIGGPAVEGLYAMTQFLSLNAQEQTPELRALLDRFQAKYGKSPDDGMIYGYMAIQLFAEGARRAGRDLTVDSLVRGLEDIRDFTTVFAASPVSYGPEERLGTRRAMLTQVRDGRFMQIAGPLTY